MVPCVPSIADAPRVARIENDSASRFRDASKDRRGPGRASQGDPMHRPRFLTSVRVLATAALLPFLMIETPADTTCTKKDVPMGCRTRTVFSEYPDPVII